jgi:prepilin-type N-terminal cleavage/methylation domain-containing protein
MKTNPIFNRSVGKAPDCRAFTLIELLTVIAIIGILAAIMIPTVGSVRKKAATTKDISKLREIGGGLLLHMNDNKGLLPNRRLPIIASRPTEWIFQEAVERYLATYSANSLYNWSSRGVMWYSPFAEAYPGWSASTGTVETTPLAFGYNSYLDDTRWMGKTSAIPNPSQTVIVGEINGGSGGGGASSRAINPRVRPDFVADKDTQYRISRSGAALYLFVAGNVRLIQGDQSEPELTSKSAPNIWRWW